MLGLKTKFEIPSSVKAEHEELHRELEKASLLPDKTGAVAKKISRLLHRHFSKEEEFALPPLGLLPVLAKNRVSAEMHPVIELCEKLKKDLPTLLFEHQSIKHALEELKTIAEVENHPEVVQFVEKLELHASNEEEVLYPAAILIGDYVKMKLQAE